ncbi:MAG: hypothetical protein MUP55_00735 [Candidatus Aenigmarchaeota archaeon]|nr:hypothetical protein [Candidatus Aenigmarchaeota archaeon]
MEDTKIEGKKVHAATKADDKGVMGRLFWYTVGGCLVPCEELKDKWTKLGLPAEWRPNDPRPSDVFKQATKSVEEEEHVKVKDEDCIATYIVEPAKSTARIRHVVRLLKKDKKEGAKEKPFNTQDVGEWELDDDDKIVVRLYVTDEAIVKKFDKMTVEVRKTYNTLKKSITENDLRYVLKEAIHRMPYILLRPSGGVYFVPNECTQRLEQFSKLLKWVSESYSTTAFKSELWQIPLVQESRDLVYEKFQDDVIERINKVFTEITDIVAKEDATVYPCKFKEYMETLEHISETYHRYTELLDDDITTVKSKMDILKEALVKLQTKVKGP